LGSNCLKVKGMILDRITQLLFKLDEINSLIMTRKVFLTQVVIDLTKSQIQDLEKQKKEIIREVKELMERLES